jgi:ubiquinone/menaquinone biosynthesis C-methylase UbiE
MNHATTDSTSRFSKRVDAYVRYRPGYPATLAPRLLAASGLDSGAAVADIGSGTGIFSQRLLEQDCRVYAVEPNGPMREAAQAQFGDNPQFISVDATAEHTGLDSGSIDLVTAAQAFHWFDNEPTREEFRRILKADGQVALIWNRRDTRQPLQQAYDGILREFAPEYGKVNHMNLGLEEIATFLDPAKIEQMHFDNSQRLDFAGLLGRLKSSSYCPAEDSTQYIPLVTELLALFDHFAVDGHIDFGYDTQVFLGPPGR